jgi:hypothetical protein
MKPQTVIAVAGVLACAWIMPPALADNVTDEDRLLCSIVEVNFCAPSGPCEQGPPWVWNVPEFIEIDLVDKELRTTPASGRNRKTPIRNVGREDGNLVLSGVEQGRSYVFSIREATGGLTVTVAAWASGGVGFGTCTPLQR